MSHALLDVRSLEFFALFDALAAEASGVEESATALERAEYGRDRAQGELATRQEELEKVRAFIREQNGRIHLVSTHWFYGTTLFQPQLWLRGGCKGKKRRAEKKLDTATNEDLPAALADLGDSETRLDESARIVEERARSFGVSANAASEREAMKARGVMEHPSDELLRLHREESAALSGLRTAEAEAGSFDAVADKIRDRQKAYHDAIASSRKALTHRDRHDVLKNNPVEMPRPIDVLRRTELHASRSEQWLPNGTKCIVVRTEPNNETHLFTVDRRNRLVLTNSPCPNGCGFLVTWHGTHCCDACAGGGGGHHRHGRRCDRRPLRSQPGAAAKLSRWEADRQKRDRDAQAELVSSDRCVEESQDRMEAADRLGAEVVASIPSSAERRHPAQCDSIRSMDLDIAGSIARAGGPSSGGRAAACHRGGGGCHPPPSAEAIHREIAATERAQGILAAQLSVVEDLARSARERVGRCELDLVTSRSSERDESDRIFRRLRAEVVRAARPPARNPSYTGNPIGGAGVVPPPPPANPAFVPSAPTEEEIVFAHRRPAGEGIAPASAAAVVPPSSFRARRVVVEEEGTSRWVVRGTTIGPATMPAPTPTPEATVLAGAYSPDQQDTIPMVDATLLVTEIV